MNMIICPPLWSLLTKDRGQQPHSLTHSPSLPPFSPPPHSPFTCVHTTHCPLCLSLSRHTSAATTSAAETVSILGVFRRGAEHSLKWRVQTLILTWAAQIWFTQVQPETCINPTLLSPEPPIWQTIKRCLPCLACNFALLAADTSRCCGCSSSR